MIRFINGGVNSDREKLMLDSICESVSSGRQVIVIIPDQFSFEYDKKLYKRLGAVRFNKITTAGFNRLAELLSKQYGSSGSSGLADENAKIVFMYKAVKALRKSRKLAYYTALADKNGIEKGNFISQLISLVQQLRESGITAEILKATAVRLNTTLAQKMNDISEIYREYMLQLEQAGLRDSVSSISASVRTARDNDYFSGKDVFVDAFSSFTYDESQMLELCIARAENVTFSFVIDEDSAKNTIHPFRLPELTFGTLKAAAKNKGYTVVKTKDLDVQSPAISYLGKNILSVNKKQFDGSFDSIRVLRADDIYSEAAFVCAQIQHLCEKGSSYSDIAIIVRNIEECASVYEGMLERYDIPYFIDQQERISTSSVVQYFNAVFKCLISKSYKTENILKMIKSPFYTTKKYLVNEIEQYCLKWNIDGEMWEKEYFGLDQSLVLDKEKAEVSESGVRSRFIDMIEKARKDIILPLDKMKMLCGKDEIAASRICEAFFVLLDELNVSDRTYSVVRSATINDNETQLELSRGLRQLWNSVLSAVKSIYDCLRDEKITLRQFYELYRVMLSQMTVSDPPQKIDCVRIVDASHSRLSEVRTAFICQVNDGVFPKAFSNNSLLTHIDVSQLQTALNGLEKDLVRSFGGDARNAFMREDLACYNAVSVPTERLFVTYVTADLSGEDKRPSTLIKEIVSTFKDMTVENISDIPKDFFCVSYKTAYYTAVENYRENSSVMESVKMSLDGSEYYRKLRGFADAGKAIQNDKSSADSDAAAKVFFRNGEMHISASQIDAFYKCPFRYFCMYGLKLRPTEKMELSAAHRGNIIHKVLENAFSLKDENGEPALMTDSEPEKLIEKIVDDSFEEYFVSVLKSDFGKSKSFMFDFVRLKKLAVRIVSYAREELLASKFKPYATEYKFGSGDDSTHIEFNTAGGKKLSVSGYIDRIDTSPSGDGELVRVIDYKTGEIDIDYSLLQCGLNLQMFVYLDAYLRSAAESRKLEAAAVEYFPFKKGPGYFDDRTVDIFEIPELLHNNTISSYKPKGLTADDERVISAFGKSDTYAPFSEKSGKIPYDELQALRKYSCSKTIEFADAVENGSFPMKPVTNQCSFCDYKAICSKENYSDYTDPSKMKKELTEMLRETLAQINKQDKEGGEQK